MILFLHHFSELFSLTDTLGLYNRKLHVSKFTIGYYFVSYILIKLCSVLIAPLVPESLKVAFVTNSWRSALRRKYSRAREP